MPFRQRQQCRKQGAVRFSSISRYTVTAVRREHSTEPVLLVESRRTVNAAAGSGGDVAKGFERGAAEDVRPERLRVKKIGWHVGEAYGEMRDRE